MKARGVLLLGLTGGIGSGKSTVASMLAQKGVPVVDADAISRRLTQAGGAAMPLIQAAFGPQMLEANGSMNRVRMRELVFAQPAARLQLEALLHPLIGQDIQTCVAHHVAQGASCIALDIPLITPHSHWPGSLDRILVVDCLTQTQIQRVQQRSQLSGPEVQAMVEQQIARATRLALADWVIYNQDLNLEQLRQHVHALPLPWPVEAQAP